jgi:hypothetical protein
MTTEEEKRQKQKELAEKFARETKQTPNGKASPEELAETASEYLPQPARGAGEALKKNKRDTESAIKALDE